MFSKRCRFTLQPAPALTRPMSSIEIHPCEKEMCLRCLFVCGKAGAGDLCFSSIPIIFRIFDSSAASLLQISWDWAAGKQDRS